MSAPARAARSEPGTAVDHRCPLCGGTFAEEHHCNVCPMNTHCHILCCPHCGYSFVERSGLVDWVRGMVARWRGRGGTKGDAGG